MDINYEKFFPNAPIEFMDGMKKVFTCSENSFGGISVSVKSDLCIQKYNSVRKALTELKFDFPGFDDGMDTDERAMDEFLLKMEDYLNYGCSKDNYRYGMYVVSVFKGNLGV